MTLGERLRKSRRATKYTQEDVSKKLGIDLSTVSKWESGKNTPNIETVRTLAELYNVSLSYLLEDEPDDDLYKDLDPELVEALKAASPEDQEHFRKYLRGEVEDPVWFSETEKSFERDLQEGIDIMELFDKYNFTLGGITPTKEEIEELAKYLKAIRIMKMM